MKNKILSLGLALVIIIAGFLIAGALSNSGEMPRRKASAQKHKPFTFKTVTIRKLPLTIRSGGNLQAYHKIILFAEVTGVLHEAQTSFRTGNKFKRNETLLRIDDSVYRNNVLAQKSGLLNQLTLFLPDFAIDFPVSAEKWRQYLTDFQLNKALKPLPPAADSKEQYFIASRNIYNLYYSVKSMEATLDKYTLRAPFDGVVTEADITPGSLVRAGQKLGEFTNENLYELEATLNIPDLAYVHPGDPVRLTSEDMAGEFKGTVRRINGKIDPSTQTVKAYVSVSDRRLKDGMYLIAQITCSGAALGIRIPTVWLVDQNKLYVKADSVLRLTPVTIVRNEGDFVIVNGLKDGQQILAQESPGTGSGEIKIN